MCTMLLWQTTTLIKTIKTTVDTIIINSWHKEKWPREINIKKNFFCYSLKPITYQFIIQGLKASLYTFNTFSLYYLVVAL